MATKQIGFSYSPPVAGIIKVTLDGRQIGTIRQFREGFRYLAKGLLRHAGEPFPTLADCKASIQGDD